MRTVILTNEAGQDLGECEVMEAHTSGGKLHQAFSVIVFNTDKSKLLIQKRAEGKLLFANFWANTCCSHPKGAESIEKEAERRLEEECGFRCTLTPKASFTYQADCPSGNGTEYEYDTVLTGTVDEAIELKPDPAEIAEIKWIGIDELQTDMKVHSSMYAPWFHLALPLALRE